jgi:myosin protein heavy chain
MAESLLLEHGPDQFDFLKKTRLNVDGVDDLAEWRVLKVS